MNHTAWINLLLIEDVPVRTMNLVGRLEGESYRVISSTDNGPRLSTFAGRTPSMQSWATVSLTQAHK
ncbi:hypothetical protein [Spirosoma rhododendri]|uniref:Uncharacterized protein n=1 Tax=Spirosoma rhododendri TaxID=2728024 RepID=A0A7L5DW29_9BACT|nr:hypothetical protein [Spirosoma rhododendri]QJD81661.1 hypothetical protein HH216_25305 [Spirosoma rhododendri]